MNDQYMEDIGLSSYPSEKRKINIDIDSDNNNDLNITDSDNKMDDDKIRRTEDVIIPLKVDLLQLFMSQPQSLSVVRNRLCRECDGKGISDLHIISPKLECDPTLANKCGRCFGRGVFPDEKQFTFSIQGYSHNEEIRFKHEADEKVMI